MMQFIENLVGPEHAVMASYIAMAVAALVVLLILWLLVSVIRKPRFASSRRSKQARLAITDAATVDSKRRLVLLRRDDVEHLIMIGGPTDIVIETDIRRKKPAAATQTAPTAALTTPPITPALAKTTAAATAAPAIVAPAIVAIEPKPAVTPSRTPSAAPAVAKVSTALGGITGAATSAVAATTSTVTSAASSTTSAVSTAADRLTDLALPDQKDTSIEDDMNSLLDEIATPEIVAPKKD